jgi:ATP-dependent helicase/nuclease subunit B
MGLRIVHGGIGSGRTRRCLEEIRESWDPSCPDRRALLVVPDPLKLDTEAFLLEATGRDGLMMAEVLSFQRLAERLMGEVGGLADHYADASGRSMCIHRVLKAKGQELTVFGPMADRPGFVPQIETVLSEFRRYGIRPTDLERSLEADPENRIPSSFRNKTRDLATILRDYEETLERLGLKDPSGDLDRLAEILRNVGAAAVWPYDRLAWLSNASVWIDGFGERRDFTPQESRVIEALVEVCREVTVTLCTDSVPADRGAVEDGPDALLIGRRTAFHLNQKLATRLQPGGIVALDAKGRGRHPELLHLRRSLEQGLSIPFTEQAGAVVVYHAFDAYEETSWVAGEIRRLVFREGFRFRDIAVAACAFDAYAPLLEAAFDAYGISGFMDREVKLSGTALPRFVLAFLAMSSSSWSLGSVMSCLRSGLADIAPDETDRFENYCLSRGISGKSRIFDDRRYGSDFDADPTAGLADEETVDAPLAAGAFALGIRNRSLKPLRDALDDVSGRKTCAERCAALESFLHGYDMHARVYRLARRLREKGTSDGAMRLVKSWNALGTVLRQMETVAGEESIPLEDFSALLSAGIDACKAGTIPASPDAVLAGPPDRVIARRPSVLFVLGTSSDALPMKGVAEGLLNAADRERLFEKGGLALPSGVADKPFEDAFREYSLLSLPTELLYVGYAETDRKGSNVEPSATLGRIRSLLPNCRTLEIGPLSSALADDSRLLIPSRVETGDTTSSSRSLQMTGTGLLRVVRIQTELVAGVFGLDKGMSVSQLETYASCPYSHFCKYILKLKPREVWKPEAANIGSLAHGVVEMAMAALREDMESALREGRDPDGVLQAFIASDLERRAEDLIRATAVRDRLGLFLDEGFRTSAGRKVRRTAAESLRAAAKQLLVDELRPAYLEWGFGSDSGNPLVVQLGNGTRISFRGRVDRIDVTRKDGTERYRIIDYKSGNKDIDFDALFDGLAYQLPAYLAAFRNGMPERIPVDAAYFHLGVPQFSAVCAAMATKPEKVEGKEVRYFKLRRLDLGSVELPLAISHVQRKMRQTCEELFSGHFDVKPLRTGASKSPCTWCDYRGVCRRDDGTDCSEVQSLGGKNAGSSKEKKARFISAIQAETEGQDPS